ncbi:MAG: Wzz/FepE/Etk N-terminal domain-containing protein, partial [Serratia marcescens]|nr:Wzz/FepE/Etk N-terminal domain-containing protein [Serratia marcescens]
MKNNALSVMVAEQDEKLEWERLIGPLWDNRWRIAVVTGLAGVLGVAYALLATPVYQATAVVQVEKQLSGDSLLRETLDSTMGQSSATQDEVTLAKSRYVLGKTVDALGLTVRVSPDYFPVFGKGLARLSGEKPPVLNITTLTTPADMQGEALTLTVRDGQHYELSHDGDKLFSGVVGQP